jgi:hypothetical protein
MWISAVCISRDQEIRDAVRHRVHDASCDADLPHDVDVDFVDRAVSEGLTAVRRGVGDTLSNAVYMLCAKASEWE